VVFDMPVSVLFGKSPVKFTGYTAFDDGVIWVIFDHDYPTLSQKQKAKVLIVAKIMLTNLSNDQKLPGLDVNVCLHEMVQPGLVHIKYKKLE